MKKSLVALLILAESLFYFVFAIDLDSSFVTSSKIAGAERVPVVDIHPPVVLVPKYSLELKYLRGEIWKTIPTFDYLVKGPTRGMEICLEKQTAGQYPWNKVHHYPKIGVGASFIDLDNPDTLGQVFGLYPYIKFPILRSKDFAMDFKIGTGVSFLTKVYWHTVYYYEYKGRLYPDKFRSNLITGTHLNTYLHLGFSGRYRLAQNFSLTGEYRLSHISNGNASRPNTGVNIFNGLAGVVWHPDAEFNIVRSWSGKYQRSLRKAENLKASQAPEELYNTKIHHNEDVLQNKSPKNREKKLAILISTSGGIRTLYYQDFFNFPVATFCASINYKYDPGFRIGIGLDGFYDQAFLYTNRNSVVRGSKYDSLYDRYYIPERDKNNCYRAGISIQNEIVMGRLIAAIHTGAYFYDPIKNRQPLEDAKNGLVNQPMFYKYNIDTSDGWFYTRFLLRYAITPQFHLQFGLKNHLSKAEFMDWGCAVEM